VPHDARFQDPRRFPCAVVGCGHRAAGWIGPELLGVDLEIRTEANRVYLCTEHGPKWWSEGRVSDHADGGPAR